MKGGPKYKIDIYIYIYFFFFLKSRGPGPPWVPPNSAPATNAKHILFCTTAIHKDYKFFERISTFDDNYFKEDFIDDYLIWMISLTTWIFLRREKLVKWIFLGREKLNSFCISLAEMPYVGGNRHNFI